MPKLTLNICPVAKGRPIVSTRNRFPVVYTPLKTRQFEKEVQRQALSQWNDLKLTGGLYVAITFHMPTKNRKLWGKWHDKRPDIDNLVKATCDALNGIAWNDDAQICEINATKVYAEHGKITMEIEKRP